jgi:hypothetical protein
MQVRNSNRKRMPSKLTLAIAAMFGLAVLSGSTAMAAGATTGSSSSSSSSYTPAARGELDCNGFSTAQKPMHAGECTDIRGIAGVSNKNTWGGRFYDNGHYIGHDEPDATFLSNQAGSGGDVSWTINLGRDPKAAPTDKNPGHDVTHWFELSPAPWFSMAICDGNSYPQAPCTPNSDSNAPTCFGPTCTGGQGGGSAFMEMQFYPPGNAPFEDSTSCDNTHWCAALTIDSLECTTGFAVCNPACEEPVNFAFIQKDGVPTGPPSPQKADVATFTPNKSTLLMDPGDTVGFTMSDAATAGGGHAFEVVMRDYTRHTTGFMQASAANGFQNTSIANCAGTPHNFQPEYSTAKRDNIVPWAALQTNISTEFETGHWEACTSLSEPITDPIDPADTSQDYNECHGPYENAGPPDTGSAELGDAQCFYKGDTHAGFDGPGSSTPPNEATGCQDDIYQNGDLDFDGQPYYPDWPTGIVPTKTLASTFVEQFPASNGHSYSQYFLQSDIALSESTCAGPAGPGCTIPPQGPGGFYPYWTKLQLGGFCALEFGNVKGLRPVLNDFGKDAQYGTDLFSTLGYPEFEGPTHQVTC